MSNQVNETGLDAEAPVAVPGDTDAGAAAVDVARPKVKELLAEYQADPTGEAGVIVEALVLAQMAGEPAREADVLLLHQGRDRYRILVRDAGRTATRIDRRNRRLKKALAKRTAGQTQVRQYLEEVPAAVPASQEPSTHQIIEKISVAIGLRGPLIPRVEKGPVPARGRIEG